MAVSVLFVDDEKDIRLSFEAHFEKVFTLHLAQDGKEALELLAKEPEVGVVVTDVRMPEMGGLELIAEARNIYPDLGFIVVSGHGEADEIIEALRLGARNYLRKPYRLSELGQAVRQEIGRYQTLQEDRTRQEKDKDLDKYLSSVSGLTYAFPSRLDLVNPIAFRLVQTMETVGICSDRERGNVALALIEIIVNAIEHGNLGISGEEKLALKTESDERYRAELVARTGSPAFNGRKVRISAEMDRDQAVVTIEDEGAGFDFANLPDPTDPANLFLPTGRGILLARAFLDEVNYLEKGNVVRLVKRKSPQQN